MPQPTDPPNKLLEEIKQRVLREDIAARSMNSNINFLRSVCTEEEFAAANTKEAIYIKVALKMQPAIQGMLMNAVAVAVLRKALDLAGKKAAERKTHPGAAADIRNAILDIEKLFI